MSGITITDFSQNRKGCNMVIKDDNRFQSFYEFEMLMLQVGEALGALEIAVNNDIPCPRCGSEWHAGLSFNEDTVDVFVDAEGIEINADDPQKAVNTWLVLNGHGVMGALIPAGTYEMRQQRWATGS